MKIICAALLALLLMPWHTAMAQRPPRAPELEALWLDVSLGDPLVEWFNQAARPTDIARANDIGQLELLDSIQVGQKLVIFKSIHTAEEHLPRMADQIDIIGYNIEANPATPDDEQADPVASIARMRELADQYGLALALGPDHDFALTYGAAMAPYVDIFVLQIQRVQNNPATVREFVLPMVADLRQANPAIQISVQVRTEGNVPGVVELVESLQGSIDGVSILTSPTTLGVYEELVATLRPSSPVVDLSSIPADAPQGAPLLPDSQPTSWWLSSGSFGMGILVGAGGTLLLFAIMVVAVVVVAIAVLLLLATYHLLTKPRTIREHDR